MKFDYDHEEFEDMTIAHRMAVIDSWNEEYRKALVDIRERTTELKKAMKMMEERAL
ncbi:hypothetical protein [Rhizobium sp.]|uniref:hypothetical protein n=1 Tax=Rhizobium sp. TaxID=391 RepID=UPI0028AD65AC